jgi:hypothetical protein
MSNKKDINARIVHKHDLEKNWDNASNFIPKQGELIIYDREFSIDDLPLTRSELITYERFKIGDGSTLVGKLPFTLDIILEEARQYIDTTILNGEW